MIATSMIWVVLAHGPSNTEGNKVDNDTFILVFPEMHAGFRVSAFCFGGFFLDLTWLGIATVRLSAEQQR